MPADPSLLGRRQAFDWRSIWIALATKALVLLFGTVSYLLRGDERIPSIRRFLGIWERWDTLEYLLIARLGYDTDETRRL